jgi:type IX secretion system PorP/SprF family membrane protein
MGAGIFGGFMLYSFNASSLVTATSGDATINAATGKFIVPDFSPGIWLYSPQYYLGLSVKSIVGNTIFDKSNLTRHYYLTGGHKISAKKTPWAFIPSAFVRYSYAAPIGVDLNVMADYDDRVAFGISYRLTDGFAGLLKMNFKNFTVGYSYDYTLSKLKIASSNTHEIMLSLKICTGERAINVNGKIDPSLNRCPTFN